MTTTRTKWMRLLVRDLADVLRWAGAQNARQIGNFRYRVLNGRESVSFRLVPDYAIEIGTRDIVVVCHVRASRWRILAQPLKALTRARMRHRSTTASTNEPTASEPSRQGILVPFPGRSNAATR